MSNKTVNLNCKTLAELKKMAQALNISGRPTWGEEDYRRAIVNRQKNKVVASVVNDMNTPIPPGFARISIAETDQNGNDTPVQCLVNKFATIIPRGVIVDVPVEIVDGALNDCTDWITKEVIDPATGQNTDTRIEVKAIAFREYNRNPGPSVIKSLLTEEKLTVRNQYLALYGRWPTRKQEAEFAALLREKLGDARLDAFIEAQRQRELEKAKVEVEAAMAHMDVVESAPRKPGRPKKVEFNDSEES
jgi:hypothetical protein